MPELRAAGQVFDVAPAANLLDTLLKNGLKVPYSCRAGSCHACIVRCVAGELHDNQPQALDAQSRAQGWRLACQCQIVTDLSIELYDPNKQARRATISACDWLSTDVLRLRLIPEQPVAYRAGQHVLLWTADGIARPYSFASLPEVDPFLEFHIDCRRSGAFSNAARMFKVGEDLHVGVVSGGALRYEQDWQERPLLLLAAGTGLAPLYGVLRDALAHNHQGRIRLIHSAHDTQGLYLREPLNALLAKASQLEIQQVSTAELPAALAQLRLVFPQTLALICGQPDNVELFARSLYMAGVPRNQTFSDIFLPHA
ncbi:iron-sulfur-binding ferredoxin reductase [Pseudomonas sp. S9]|uniref:iron-sulfur-binding ferredoxin reductase n=1 Tax=Pseudomonas sp. S9 TaxID=686578 RepID=UPI0002557407|nr:iron-sulfur-binding ferredoxin reductase [Pseudomonas sp. S9]